MFFSVCYIRGGGGRGGGFVIDVASHEALSIMWYILSGII